MQKEIFKHKLLVFNYVLTALLLTLTYSCKKEYPDFPYNEIEKFSIKDVSGTELNAAIQATNIIVYWPPFQDQPDSIQPQIAVSDRAVITPRSGLKIPFKEGFSYEVKAQDGSIKTYTLKIANNQPLPYFSLNQLEVNLNGSLNLVGDYFIPEVSKTSVFLVDKNKKETQLTINSISNVGIVADIPLVLSQDTSHYHVKVITGKRTLINGPYYIDRPVLALGTIALPADALTVKRGQTLVFTHTATPGVLKYYAQTGISASVSITNRISRSVPMQITDTEMTITIPQDFPLGRTYGIVAFMVEGVQKGIWRRTGSPFTVTE
ncbi:hypothetical protein [Pedobacter nyackensis]|uniref:hypothetical protein n=1 Tax=Pedobacter nyackensis TaxID=475255 RepID=UPI0029303E5D|nr:hypothetical protein [Pedobacter nyackensis]